MKNKERTKSTQQQNNASFINLHLIEKDAKRGNRYAIGRREIRVVDGRVVRG